MSYEAKAAIRYREHAEELRVIADGDMYEATKRLLLHVAKDYEAMADTMDAIERAHKTSKAAKSHGIHGADA